MPGTHFIPTREADLVTYSVHMSSLITAGPTAYGLTAAQATSLANKTASFQTLFEEISSNDTRTPSKIIAKDDAKAFLIGEIRMLARIVQANPAVTNEQRADLGLPVRDTEPTPIPPPAYAPGIEIISVTGRVVRMRLWDTANVENRGRPAGVFGASVFSFVGPAAPTEASQWKYEGLTGKTSFDISFPESVANGATVWVTAQWFNARKETGPGAAAISTNLQGGAAQAA